MTTQTPITNIAPALARAQKKIAVADKNAINTDKQSRFADMESVIEACRDALSEQEISILQPLGGSASELLINTVLLHSSGEMLSEEFRVRPENPNDIDSVKSLITQMRRYSLMGMLCIATADDDGAKGKKPAKPAEKKEPVQIPVPVVEKHEAEQPAEPEPEAVSTSKQIGDWREVVCHAGIEDGLVHGKKLGELTPDLHKWLHEKILPTLGKSKKDRSLAEAIEESVKGPELPLTAHTPLPEPENAGKQAKNSKKEASNEPENKEDPMEWRSVVAHNFKPKPAITLGEIADSEPDAIAKGYDGAKILRGMKTEGIAKIQAKTQTAKDKILVNAILAANEELDLRDDIYLRFSKHGIDAIATAAHLVKSGVFEEGETLAMVPRKMLDYLNDNWADVEASIKGAKK